MLNNTNDRYKQQVADYFNARTNYDRIELTNRRANSFLKLLPLKKGYEVLDIATGTGLIAKEIKVKSSELISLPFCSSKHKRKLIG
ncbi:protein-L-isoaspartate(D-aspartate) O-methyltransferase [Rivularia sp. UHCC 0363]|uniref:protein-L-isoaspartate(D-aspartate) O-methyltransferase n=1 Tax=Rivularia sp. UHCC 0363 TaxID=3110244 RepID=UPI002B1F0447|nr:protein-L-isoaspartate(D-aspartate) O-methyltransferase [Rivularia sp. UHCC 0363]MEA5597022.1 protein-L-isoaspartate(D-aspartate) O-methyltransferase [Rivularia sp. UHCC 0363]